MRTFILSLIAAMLLCIAGCATIGKEIHAADIEMIVPGTTTKAETTALFGQPSGKSLDSEGKSTYMWSYGHAGPFGIGAKGQALLIVFDRNGVVERYDTSGISTD